jgi:hypothetical protein
MKELTRKEKMDIKMGFLELKFGKTLKQCLGHNDDRGLFVNCYNLLKSSVVEFYGLNVGNPIINIAYSKEYDIEFAKLVDLEGSLRERKMVQSA